MGIPAKDAAKEPENRPALKSPGVSCCLQGCTVGQHDSASSELDGNKILAGIWIFLPS